MTTTELITYEYFEYGLLFKLEKSHSKFNKYSAPITPSENIVEENWMFSLLKIKGITLLTNGSPIVNAAHIPIFLIASKITFMSSTKSLEIN